MQSFLRGPEHSATFRCFNDLPHARNWGNKYFGRGGNGTYSAQAAPGGRGAGAHCTVTKTGAWFEGQQRQHALAVRELEQTRALLLEGGCGCG